MWRSSVWLAGLLVAVIAAACTSSSAEEVPGSFYLEATITVVDDRTGAPQAEVVTTIRWWSESVDRWRWELGQTGSDEFSADGSLSVSDGETVWFYDAESNTYQRTEPFELPESFVATPFPASVLFGPANHESLDDLAAEVLSRGDDIEVFAAGTEEVLGVEATLLDYRPTWRSSSATATAPGSSSTPPAEAEEPSSGGVGRMWVDEERMFILRHEIDGGSNRQYVLVEVTQVEFDRAFDDGRFEFEVPEGATEVEPGARSSGSSG